MRLERGEVLAVIGENGAGKSTLMKILSGALMPDAGAMSLEGAPYQPRGPMDARRRGVAMVYQELSLAPHLTVAENILLGVESSRGGFIRRAGMHAAARSALAQLDRGEIPVDSRAGSLPVAVQQLVEIARALAQSDTRVLTGVGLAIVKAIVEALGGTIRTQSAGKDQGSTFTIRFPTETTCCKKLASEKGELGNATVPFHNMGG